LHHCHCVTSHREVATCPLTNYASSSSNGSIFRLRCVMIHTPTQWSNRISFFYIPQLNSPSRSCHSSDAISTVRSRAPQILRCSLLSCSGLARPLARDERRFSLSSSGHVSCNVWNHSFSCQICLLPNMPSILCLFWSTRPVSLRLLGFPNNRSLRAFPSRGVFPSDARLAAHQKRPPFYDPDFLTASLCPAQSPWASVNML